MRFMIMHKVTAEMERGDRPSPEVIGGVGQLMGEAAKDKILVDGAGLKPTSERVHLSYKGGQRTLTPGPFKDPKELVGGFALMKVKTKEEALAWCDRVANALGGNAELFMGPIVENWDLGFGEKPADAPLRVLALHRWDESHQDAKTKRRAKELADEMTKAGVLQSSAGLLGPKHATRLRFEGGRRRIVDGPFVESKELVAGYVILDLPSVEDALEWTTRFAEVVQVNEIDIRQVEVTP